MNANVVVERGVCMQDQINESIKSNLANYCFPTLLSQFPSGVVQFIIRDEELTDIINCSSEQQIGGISEEVLDTWLLLLDSSWTPIKNGVLQMTYTVKGSEVEVGINFKNEKGCDQK